MKIKEDNSKVWRGKYMGVDFEIRNWKSSPSFMGSDGEESDNWVFYLYLHLNRIPDENKPNSFWLRGKKDDRGRVQYKYYDHNVINMIELHGGCSWYSKEHGFDGSQKVIKIGCDYQHYWDNDRTYYIEDLKFDVKNCIESFLRFVPNYKYWCRGNGNLYNLKDGLIKNGDFHSEEYFGDKDWFKELKTLKS